MFEATRKRLTDLKQAPAEAARMAAPQIQAALRQAATTKRGNVPSFGEMGNVPITAEARGESIVITAPDWVLEKARELGQVAGWIQIVADAGGKVMRE